MHLKIFSAEKVRERGIMKQGKIWVFETILTDFLIENGL
jgi:hypothetical protein